MPLPYRLVTELLEQCSTLCSQRRSYQSVVHSWFARHRALISAHDTDIAALLSTLLPDLRSDRVYCIQAPTLEKIVGRALGLGVSRIKDLTAYRQLGSNADLADCVERILNSTPNPLPGDGSDVTVEQVDALLHSLASRTIWSSPSVRTSQASRSFSGPNSRSGLEVMYKRLSATEAKWFTRLLLKTYQPLILKSEEIFGLCDESLPAAMKIMEDFAIAVRAVQLAKTRLLPNASTSSHQRQEVLQSIKPQIGVKVGRQPWLKGRSIKHCLDMGHGRMSVEEKIDGEYCQIHFNRDNKSCPIQIFSKSGKDSTEDRKKVHSAIMDSLRRNHSEFNVDRQCILEAELVVYSDRERRIRPFHTIRNYVTRRGIFLDTEQDSGPKEYEHLMVVYFDALLIDDKSLLPLRHSERRQELKRVVTCIPGRAVVVDSLLVDFDQRRAASDLRNRFAQTIVKKGEGLVVKPDEPYFDFNPTRRFASSCIKLKKDYIGNFGDIGDFAVVGAGYDAGKAKSYNIPNLKWTHFYLGCLDNKEEAKRWDVRPEFQVICIVQLNESLLRSLILNGITEAVPADQNQFTVLKVARGLLRRPPLQICFTQPPVFDLRCFSFDKEGNNGFWTPRFPSISKVHFDRNFLDTITFDELQERAAEAANTPELEDSQENLEWIRRLEGADPRGTAVDAVSQLTTSSLATPSPRKRTQSFSSRGSPHSPTTTRSQPDPVGAQCRKMPKLDIPRLKLPRLTPPRLPEPQDLGLCHSYRQMARVNRTEDTNGGQSSSDERKPGGHLSEGRPNEQAKGFKRRASQLREPLSDIAGNEPRGRDFLAPLEEKNSTAKPVAIDLTRSPSPPQSPDTTASELSSSGGENPTDTEEITAMTIPDPTEGSTEVTGPRTKTALRNGASLSAEDPISSPVAQGSCIYARRGCHFTRRTVFMTAELGQDAEFLRHVESHAIESIVMKPCHDQKKEWLGRLAKKPLLLVDSVKAREDALLLIREMKTVLDTVRERPWIPVYDYRVLGDIRILEDATVEKKYYGGFTDPWRRWHVGTI